MLRKQKQYNEVLPKRELWPLHAGKKGFGCGWLRSGITGFLGRASATIASHPCRPHSPLDRRKRKEEGSNQPLNSESTGPEIRNLSVSGLIFFFFVNTRIASSCDRNTGAGNPRAHWRFEGLEKKRRKRIPFCHTPQTPTATAQRALRHASPEPQPPRPAPGKRRSCRKPPGQHAQPSPWHRHHQHPTAHPQPLYDTSHEDAVHYPLGLCRGPCNRAAPHLAAVVADEQEYNPYGMQ